MKRYVRAVHDDIEAIRRLKARYFRCIDTKDWDGLRAILCDDVDIDVHADSGRRYTGADAFVTSVSRNLAGATSVHHGHMPEIDILGVDEATGVWAMEDEIWFPPGGPIEHLHGYGHYHERYRRVDGEWRIAALTLVRIRRDVRPAG